MMTGYYPFRTGTQNGVLLQMDAGGVPLDFPFLPQHLRKLGYRNHLVGKWHLGYCKREFLPTSRGFDYFYGYYGPQEGYFNHSATVHHSRSNTVARGLDLFREVNGVSVPDFSKNGVYSTNIFTDEAMRILSRHPRASPFFLFLSFQSVHAPLQVPPFYYRYCPQLFHDYKRLLYSMLVAMDEAIGSVITHLKQTGLYDDTVILFSSDNGGDLTCGASNVPLRGTKNTIWEGGTKTTTFVHSPKHIQKFAYRPQLFHVVDWHATLLGIAGAGFDKYGDGINQWPMILGTSGDYLRRTQFIYNVDMTMSAIRKGDFKLILETTDPTRRFGGHVRLFRISTDPTETHEISRQHPVLTRQLVEQLVRYQMLARKTVRTGIDLRGNPSLLGGAFASYWC
ncbi:CRE-SUL-3 protein [Aphelenchoides avenae]|nr:CRE-SUL-3 protein [Aphelenchus avenae]